MSQRFFLSLAALGLLCGVGRANISIPSDGSDGAFNPTSNVEIDLSQAVTGQWDAPNTANTGKGIYDSSKWAVVFKYSSVNIPAGVTVTFKNHPANPPVVWLVQGDVTITGIVNLRGAGDISVGNLTEPGPGGFRGGSRGSTYILPSPGFGPGGGKYNVFSGASGSSSYLNPKISYLIGGSGGSGSNGGGSGGVTSDGGAGGGAILIACATKLTLEGLVDTGGGGGGYYGGGSSGAVRLVCDTLAGRTGRLLGATTSTEANHAIDYFGQPSTTFSAPATPPQIWPPSNWPAVTVTRIGNVEVPSDPLASFNYPGQDVTLDTTPSVLVTIAATNVPVNWKVVVRLVPRTGPDSTFTATFLSGDAVSSVWQAQMDVPFGLAAVQARASAS
ncbi:MAG TPA: hypothetical protein VGM51_01045 [Armatimonadota bacterium]|jgi:hypothetical protein